MNWLSWWRRGTNCSGRCTLRKEGKRSSQYQVRMYISIISIDSFCLCFYRDEEEDKQVELIASVSGYSLPKQLLRSKTHIL